MLFCVLRVSTHYFYLSVGLRGVESSLPFRCQDCNQVTGPKPYIELKEANARWSSNVIGWMSWASGWWSTWPGSCCWSVGSQAMRCSTCPQCRELCCKNTHFFGCCFFPLLLDSCSAGVLCPKVACIPCAKQVKGRRVVCRCALWKVLDSPWHEVRTHPMAPCQCPLHFQDFSSRSCAALTRSLSLSPHTQLHPFLIAALLRCGRTSVTFDPFLSAKLSLSSSAWDAKIAEWQNTPGRSKTPWCLISGWNIKTSQWLI